MAGIGTLQSLISNNQKKVPGSPTQRLVKGSNGVLSEESPPQDIQSLSGQAGLQVPPTDPVSAGALGATPSQQKMMGSPAQVQSALRIAQDPSQDLSTATRQQQARTQATGQEQAAQKKSQDMQGLDKVGDRVTQFIDAQRQKLAAATVQATDVQTAMPTTVTGLPTDPTALASVKDASRALLANPQDMNSLLTLNKALGRDVNSTVTPQELQQFYESSTATLARSGAANVQDSLQVQDLINQGSFGYDLPTLSHLVNVPAAQLASMTVAQLRTAIDQEQSQEFSKSAQVDQQAQSGVLGAAEKAQAHSLGQEASATGQRASEADFSRLDNSIQNADQVSFGGQMHQVDELLKDDTISGIIKAYLDAGEGSPARKQLEQTEPGLVQFIHQNEKVLADASTAMGNGAQAFTGIQTSNQALNKVGNTTIDSGLLKSVLPGYGELSASKLDTAKSAFFQAMSGLSDPQKQAYATEANALATGHPEIAKQFASLTTEQLAALQLDKGETSPKIQAFEANQKQRQALDATSPDNADAVLQMATGDSTMSSARLQDILKTNLAAKTLGLDAPDSSQFESKPGVPLDSQTLFKRIQAATPEATLADAAEGKAATYKPLTPQTYQPTDAVSTTVMSKLAPLAADGTLTPDELRSAGLGQDEIFSILDSGIAKKWGPASYELSQEVQAAQNTNTQAFLQQAPVDQKSIAQLLSEPPIQKDTDGKGTPGWDGNHIGKVQAAEAQITTQVTTLQDLLKNAQANPAAAERLNVPSIQASIANYQALVAKLHEQEHQGMDQSMMGEGQSGIIDAAPGGKTSTLNTIVGAMHPDLSDPIGNADPRKALNPMIKGASDAKKIAKKIFG